MPALIQKALDAGGDDEPRDIMFVVADAAAAGAGEGAAHQADPCAQRRNGSWCRRRATRRLTEILQGLLDQGYGLAEIAGNHDILITVIAPDAAKLDIKGTTELFSLELDARPGFRRAGLKARIDRLVDINRDLKAKGASIEHFYDY